MEPTEFPRIFRHGRDLYTENATPGVRVYGEDLLKESGTEYRRWDPFRSKLAAYLLKGGPSSLFERVRSVLYLGGSHGTTVSHLSDLLPGAPIFVIEKSPLSFAPLLELSRRRENLLPILADAQLPERYAADVGTVDLLYQDVAQRAQARIFGENANACLNPSGRGLLMLKVRSISQSRTARSVVAEARRELAASGLSIGPEVDLAPFSRDHLAVPVTG
ncbi:MAG: fibrillarin-like rRNA/tRNA 2'-O-methyltransferase [Thermoplasmata archaeon]|nr:fibrillarin-like rRNA/tRNA 2'-O-methyltransferase [Thermoplasmata archaeon]MCI4359647.1 fibrillarin-like rRNA/tRNA 2'-O-methyltransferase [Thermoplasmata archaeon]